MRDNEQATKPTRRTIIAGLAAATAAAVPAIAIAATANDNPDRELLDLGRRYQDLETQSVAADAHLEQCYDGADDPQPSEVLRHRLEDHVFGLQLPMLGTCGKGLCSDPKFNDFYSATEVKRLRYAPPPFDPAEMPAQKARIGEIERERERWLAACSAARERAGIPAAEAATQALSAEQRSLGKAIAAAPAKTLEGLRVRALIIKEIYSEIDFKNMEDGCTDEIMYRSIVRDLVAMT